MNILTVNIIICVFVCTKVNYDESLCKRNKYRTRTGDRKLNRDSEIESTLINCENSMWGGSDSNITGNNEEIKMDVDPLSLFRTSWVSSGGDGFSQNKMPVAKSIFFFSRNLPAWLAEEVMWDSVFTSSYWTQIRMYYNSLSFWMPKRT